MRIAVEAARGCQSGGGAVGNGVGAGMILVGAAIEAEGGSGIDGAAGGETSSLRIAASASSYVASASSRAAALRLSYASQFLFRRDGRCGALGTVTTSSG